MNYEYILIFWFFTVCLTSLSLITMTLKRRNIAHAKQLLLMPGFKTLALPAPDLSLADSFIFYIKRIESYKKFSFSYYNFDYLRVWLQSHLTKYPDGILPKQLVSFAYTDNHSRHEFTFYDGTTDKNQKYIKAMFAILKPLKKLQSSIDCLESLDVVKQAEAVVSNLKPRIPAKKRATKTNRAIVAV